MKYLLLALSFFTLTVYAQQNDLEVQHLKKLRNALTSLSPQYDQEMEKVEDALDEGVSEDAYDQAVQPIYKSYFFKLKQFFKDDADFFQALYTLTKVEKPAELMGFENEIKALQDILSERIGTQNYQVTSDEEGENALTYENICMLLDYSEEVIGFIDVSLEKLQENTK